MAPHPQFDGRPLLVAVRWRAPVSMPGMLDTVLDVGLGAKPQGVLAFVVAVAFMAAACAGGAGLDVAFGPVDHSCPVANSCQHGR